MRTFAVILLTLVLAISFMGCSKKQEALEDMQQPMSPEDLNRLKTETQQPIETGTVVPTTETSQELLPPSGPYKPTAKEIQAALKNAGFYAGAIDGKIGPASKQAIEAFQKANGLTADGKVGPKTWNALGKYLGATPASPTSQSSQ